MVSAPLRIPRAVLCAAAALAVLRLGAECRWTNLAPEKHIAGRMASPGYLRGKIVILDRRDYANKECESELRKLQAAWTSYKTKDFVLVGSHCGAASADEVAKIAARLGLTYPIYANANADPDGADSGSEPSVAVYDCVAGRRLLSGRFAHDAIGMAGSALMNLRVPPSPKVWKRCLDYEFEQLPGRACLRLKELEADRKALAAFTAEYPDDIVRYRKRSKALARRPEMRKLVDLVRLSRIVKDCDPSLSRKLSAKALAQKIEQFSVLKNSEDEIVAQEAKNAIADLIFAKASMEKPKCR